MSQNGCTVASKILPLDWSALLKSKIMSVFRILLILFTIIIGSYTVVVMGNYGLNLFPVFINNVLDMTWSGQFNLDF